MDYIDEDKTKNALSEILSHD